MSVVVNVTNSTFKEEVLDSNQAILVDFWAPWCGYCTRLSPVLEELAEDLGDDLKVVKVNVDENRDLATKYNVKSLPTLLVMKEGQVADTLMGFMPKASLLAKVKPHL